MEDKSLPNIGVELGIGFQTFTEELGDVTTAGGVANLRTIFGPRSRIGLELAYLGTWNETERSESRETSVNVFTNAGEAVLRLNFGDNRSTFRPFIGGGANYTRIDSAINSPIGSLELDDREGIGFPVVAGIQILPTKYFMVSARGNYTILSNLMDESLGNQWGGTVNWGVVF